MSLCVEHVDNVYPLYVNLFTMHVDKFSMLINKIYPNYGKWILQRLAWHLPYEGYLVQFITYSMSGINLEKLYHEIWKANNYQNDMEAIYFFHTMEHYLFENKHILSEVPGILPEKLKVGPLRLPNVLQDIVIKYIPKHFYEVYLRLNKKDRTTLIEWYKQN